MASYTPIGLSYYIPANGSQSFDTQSIVSTSGKVGPVTFKITNTATSGGFGPGQTAYVSWTATLPPGPTPTPTVYTYDYAYVDKTYTAQITVIEGVSTTTVITASSINWRQDEQITIPGSAIGGVDGVNDFTYLTIIDPLYPEPDPPFIDGPIIGLTFQSGITPGSPVPAAPTQNNPTNTVIIPPATTEYVQIPNSLSGNVVVPTTLIVGNQGVYVTPVQLI